MLEIEKILMKLDDEDLELTYYILEGFKKDARECGIVNVSYDRAYRIAQHVIVMRDTSIITMENIGLRKIQKTMQAIRKAHIEGNEEIIKDCIYIEELREEEQSKGELSASVVIKTAINVLPIVKRRIAESMGELGNGGDQDSYQCITYSEETNCGVHGRAWKR